MTPLQKVIRRRYGTPGGGNYPYLVDSATGMNKYVVYAPTLTEALSAYKRRHTYDPYQIRMMSDNE